MPVPESARVKLYMVVGVLMLFLGPTLALFGVINLVPPTFFLYFLAYVISLVGLLLGSLGIRLMFSTKKKRDSPEG